MSGTVGRASRPPGRKAHETRTGETRTGETRTGETRTGETPVLLNFGLDAMAERQNARSYN